MNRPRISEIDHVWIGSQRVAELTGFSRVKVWRLSSEGKIPAYRPRGAYNWRYRSVDIHRWLEQSYNGAPMQKEESWAAPDCRRS